MLTIMKRNWRLLLLLLAAPTLSAVTLQKEVLSFEDLASNSMAYQSSCSDSTLLRLTPIQWYLAYTCTFISGGCLALFVAERACRSGRLVWLYPGRTVHALAWTLLLAHLTFLLGVGRDEVQVVCTAVAAALHYLLLSSFFWLNVMCVDIFRCFFFGTYRPVAGRLFLRSALYAWGLPALITALALGLDQIEELTAESSKTASAIKPCYARGGACFFGSGAGFGVLFGVPVCLLLLVDGLAFAAIIFWMRDSRAEAAQRREEAAQQQEGDAEAAKVTVASLRRRRSSAISSREHHRFKAYVRLSLVLTMPWCCGVVAAVGEFPFLWYAAVALVGLQGAFLFVAFGAKRRLTQMAWKKATGKPLRRRTTRRQQAAKAADGNNAEQSQSGSQVGQQQVQDQEV
ncbi:adhesion G protein-coupled receptor E3-like [Neocloeon triangulifer]|uniref:adhesion G protein-coupled receptor E3-like n=1 Tax=Neocloeon triangulifer TaxID=2078957 RepID=UPI00286EC647|nr:adhesion G protein-coupled receptor E3-like [Neocloeon triangulifer]